MIGQETLYLEVKNGYEFVYEHLFTKTQDDKALSEASLSSNSLIKDSFCQLRTKVSHLLSKMNNPQNRTVTLSV